jgi:dCMP deaminase
MSWPHHGFMKEAFRIALLSKDPSTKVGAVLVDERGVSVAYGWNHIPTRLSPRYEPAEEKYPRTIHAEQMALINAGSKAYKARLYVTFMPCDRCAASIVYAGVKEVIAPPFPEEKTHWRETMERASRFFCEAGVKETVYVGANDAREGYPGPSAARCCIRGE